MAKWRLTYGADHKDFTSQAKADAYLRELGAAAKRGELDPFTKKYDLRVQRSTRWELFDSGTINDWS
jgi:hypothetical protein